MAEWYTVPCLLRGFEPQTSTNACRHICRYMDQKGLVAMLTFIQSAGVTPEVNLRITQSRKHAKGIHPGFETQGRCDQKYITGVSVAPTKRTYVLQKFLKNKMLTSDPDVDVFNVMLSQLVRPKFVWPYCLFSLTKQILRNGHQYSENI